MKRQPKIHIQATNFTVQLEKKSCCLTDPSVIRYIYTSQRDASS